MTSAAAVPTAVRGTRKTLIVVASVLVLFSALLCSTLVGPAGLSARGVLLDLLNGLPLVDIDSGLTAQQHAILWNIRLPRVVLGALVGATLAIAGAAYQGVFRNPLADPYLLGVSSGAGLGRPSRSSRDCPRPRWVSRWRRSWAGLSR